MQNQSKSRHGRKPLNRAGGPAQCVNVRVTPLQLAAYWRIGGANALRGWLEQHKDPEQSLHEEMLRLQDRLRERCQQLDALP